MWLPVNNTLNPCLHKTLMHISDAIVRCGMMCPVRIVGIPVMVMSHSLVDVILHQSGMLMMIGVFAVLLLVILSISMMKMDVVPVSAMAWLE